MNLFISDNYLGTEMFINFIGTPSAKIYFFLLKYIVISKVDWTIGNINLYEDFYKKGYLVSRYTQEDLALFFNLSQSTISKNLKTLNNMGFIKTFKIKNEKGKPNIYIFGEVKNNRNTLYFNEILEKNKNSLQIFDMIKKVSNFGVKF